MYNKILEVAPHAGAWIETTFAISRNISVAVAPHAGAWIETMIVEERKLLKSVAPHAGAWIETFTQVFDRLLAQSRTPRGCVD